MANILEEVQHYVADKLNADPQLSACPFLVENRKDIDYEIKNALGRQGVCGLVMTPKATYAGAYMDVGLAWQIDELEIDVVENVAVNRGKKDNDFITGQDAAMRLFEVLCPLSGDGEGAFCPVSYEEGEDNSLLVNRSVLKCLVHRAPPRTATKAVYQNGDVVEYEIRGELQRGQLSGLTSIASLDIGRGVTGLATNALYSCVNLSSVTIPNSVSGVGGAAFMNCYRLSAVSLPGSVKSLGGSAFQGCTALMDASLGDGLSAVPEGTFYGCTRLSSAALPRNAAYVGEGAFEACAALRSVEIPDSVSSLNNSAFGRCANLESVRMPSGLVEIREYAFDRCAGLSSVVIPEGVAYIGADAFIGCTGVAEVYCYPNPANLTWDEADKDDFKPDGSTVCHVRPEYLDGYVYKFGGDVNVTFAGDLTAAQ